MCLADLDSLCCHFNNLTDKIVTPTTEVSVIRQFGHPFVLWGKSLQQFIIASFAENPCYLTSAELSRLHRRFGHPSVEKLHALLERSGHDSDKEAITKLTKFCEFCQKHGKSPGRFKFRRSSIQSLCLHRRYVPQRQPARLASYRRRHTILSRPILTRSIHQDYLGDHSPMLD